MAINVQAAVNPNWIQMMENPNVIEGLLPDIPGYEKVEKYEMYKRPCAINPIEIHIHSSSHFTGKRKLWKKIVENLHAPMYRVEFHADGGRTWDKRLIYNFLESQEEGSRERKLHIVLLGDNDVRTTGIAEDINPLIEEFGKIVTRKNKTDDEIFINGILPFPVMNKHDSKKLIRNFCRYTHAMGDLVIGRDKVKYIPTRNFALDFCRRKNVTMRMLFNRDEVHLSSLGEEFLTEHIVDQARAYAASRGNCTMKRDLLFYHNIAKSSDGRGQIALKVMSDTRVEVVKPEPVVWSHQAKGRPDGGLADECSDWA
jgi:hypothetical protein